MRGYNFRLSLSGDIVQEQGPEKALIAPRLSAAMKLNGHGVVQAVTMAAGFPFCRGMA